MSRIIVDTIKPSMRFESCGQFIGTPGWIHEQRTLPSFELIFVKKGLLPLNMRGENLDVKPGEFLLIPPTVTHRGDRRLKAPLEFFWMHFRFPSWRYGEAGPAIDTETEPDDSTSPNTQLPLHDNILMLPEHDSPINTDRLTIMFDQLLDIYQISYPAVSQYCTFFATCILYEIANSSQSVVVDKTTYTRQNLQKVQDWIRINAFENISVNQIACQFNYSPSYLSTIYKQHFGITITEDVTHIRLEHAKNLLLSTSLPIQQIAENVGYNDAKYFMRVFKQHVGMTPTRYRASFTKRHFNNI